MWPCTASAATQMVELGGPRPRFLPCKCVLYNLQATTCPAAPRLHAVPLMLRATGLPGKGPLPQRPTQWRRPTTSSSPHGTRRSTSTGRQSPCGSRGSSAPRRRPRPRQIPLLSLPSTSSWHGQEQGQAGLRQGETPLRAPPQSCWEYQGQHGPQLALLPPSSDGSRQGRSHSLRPALWEHCRAQMGRSSHCRHARRLG